MTFRKTFSAVHEGHLFNNKAGIFHYTKLIWSNGLKILITEGINCFSSSNRNMQMSKMQHILLRDSLKKSICVYVENVTEHGQTLN